MDPEGVSLQAASVVSHNLLYVNSTNPACQRHPKVGGLRSDDLAPVHSGNLAMASTLSLFGHLEELLTLRAAHHHKLLKLI